MLGRDIVGGTEADAPVIFRLGGFHTSGYAPHTILPKFPSRRLI
jgi:hypothetical protein